MQGVGNPFGGIGRLPVKLTSDLRSLPNVEGPVYYSSGPSDCISTPSLDISSYNMAGSVRIVYKHWATKTPPDCDIGVHPGDSVTTYPASTGFPDLGTPCVPTVSTCLGDGSGSYDVPKQPFPTCVDQAAIAGVCGSAHGVPLSVIPSGSALCTTGAASAVAGVGPWSWSCAGQFGGLSAACATSAVSPPGGDCGVQWYAMPMGPTNDADIPPGTCRTFGSNIAFTTKGADLVAAACPSCSKLCCPAWCGIANGSTTSTVPSGSDLCKNGTPTAVSGSGSPWSWTCQGVQSEADSPLCAATKTSPIVPRAQGCGWSTKDPTWNAGQPNQPKEGSTCGLGTDIPLGAEGLNDDCGCTYNDPKCMTGQSHSWYCDATTSTIKIKQTHACFGGC